MKAQQPSSEVLANRKRANDWYHANKARARANQKTYYENNRESVLEQQRGYQRRHNEWIRIQQKLYSHDNRSKITAQKRRRRKTDEDYRIICNQRSRLKCYLKSTNSIKSAATFRLIGCTAAELRAHLVSQLPDGTNLAEYEVDHIFPLARYTPNEQHKFMHWSNVQPLRPLENARKGSKLPTKAMGSKVERWAWPDGVDESNLPELL